MQITVKKEDGKIEKEFQAGKVNEENVSRNGNIYIEEGDDFRGKLAFSDLV